MGIERQAVGLRMIAPLVAALAILALAAAPALGVPTWTPKAPVPSVSTGVEAMSVGVTDGFIVAAYGFDGANTNLTRIYSMPTDSWSFGAPAPLPARSGGAGILRDGKLYSIGGQSGVVLPFLERYNKATDTWTSLNSMTVPRAGLGAAVSGRYIYAIGGRLLPVPCGGAPLGVMERYDTFTNTWAFMATLPLELSDAGALAMGNGKIYVFGGCTAVGVVVPFTWIYDIVTNTWSSGTPMPTPRAAFSQVGFAGPDIYVMGGIDSAHVVTPVNEVYHTATNSWSASAPMIHPRMEMGVGSVGGTIWTVGGAFPVFGVPANALDTFRP